MNYDPSYTIPLAIVLGAWAAILFLGYLRGIMLVLANDHRR